MPLFNDKYTGPLQRQQDIAIADRMTIDMMQEAQGPLYSASIIYMLSLYTNITYT